MLLTTFSTIFIAASAFSIYTEFDKAYLEADFRIWLAIMALKVLIKLILTWCLALSSSSSTCSTSTPTLTTTISYLDNIGVIWFFIGNLLLLLNLDGIHTFPYLFVCVCVYVTCMYAYYISSMCMYIHLG
ncbi:hypothetical protein EON63_17715, partial [archaeon]